MSFNIIRYKAEGFEGLVKAEGDMGYDLRSLIPTILPAGGRLLIPTHITAIDLGYNLYWAIVCSRSGLAAKHGVCVLNAPGIIDPSYQGHIKVILQNHGQVPFEMSRGDRIAQLIILPTPPNTKGYKLSRVDNVVQFEATARATAGFGSTGIE